MTCRRDLKSEPENTFPYFVFLPVIAALAAVLLLILRSRRTKSVAEMAAPPREPVKSIRLPAEEPTVKPPAVDDLTRIEGIGPKVAATLAAAGIKTYRQLARLKVEEIREILRKAGNRISNPTTWPEQARLAADGKWGELEKLQAELKGGRPV
jgi:predicted flap endonuclease-1-like 5' DNA nuclease